MATGKAFEGDRRHELFRYVSRVLIAAAIGALLFLAWKMRVAFLLAIAALVVAVLVDAAARPVRRWTKLSRVWALAVAAIALGVVIASLAWLVGSQVQAQVAQLLEQLAQAVAAIEQRVGLPFVGGEAGRAAEPAEGTGASLAADLLQRLASYGMTILEALSALVLVVVAGFFLAADPETYRRGLVKLFPQHQHQRIDDTLRACGEALRLWLLAELIAMSMVGVLVGLGTWLIGLEAPLALGLFAGLAEFVPILGPVIGAVPALVLAVNDGTMSFAWSLLLFVAVQQLESNVITPIVQRRVVTVPPVLLLFAVVAFGLLFGILGVIVAAPLALLLYAAIQKLYIRETLREPTEVPGS